jgi:3'-5' exoribonuclease
MIVNHFSVVDGRHVELSDFLARTDKDTDMLFDEIKQIVGRIENGQIKTIVSEFMADGKLMKEFCSAPGGVKLHHNCLGGLLVHTHNMLKVAEAILPFYPDVQQDLVLAGIFIHDMGKTEELSYDIAFSYTDSGQLIGHITKSLLMFHKKVDSLEAKGTSIDKEIVDALGHIIISHHGAYEFGSPKLPATAEAFMVNYIDDLDAKMSQVTSLIDNEPGKANWTAWQNTLQTKIYRKRLE